MKAILTYHSLDDSGSAISLPPQAFTRHLAWLTSGRVRVLTLDELAAHPGDSSDAVAVTFDDGFLNVRDSVERLLDNAIPATVFVVSGHVGGTNAWSGRSQPGIPTLPLLGWSDLEFLAARGAAVEAHTRRLATRAAAVFRFGHTTDFRFMTNADAMLRLPRFDMYYFQAPGSLEAWGTPAFGRKVLWCRVRRKIRARLVGGWAPP